LKYEEIEDIISLKLNFVKMLPTLLLQIYYYIWIQTGDNFIF